MITQNTTEPKTYVLSIAISEYTYFDSLPNATKDANAILKVLWDKYKIEKNWTLENSKVTPNSIKEAFKEIKEAIKENDSLIVFYNGHGLIMGENDTAYWQFGDSKIDDIDSYYNCMDLINEIAELEIQHVALLVNSCYSGSIFDQDGLNRHSSNGGGSKSRNLFTSGLKNQSTRDSNATNTSSPFAEAFIEILSNNEEHYKLSLLNVVSFVRSQFDINDFGSSPRYGTFKGDEGGLFVFYLKEDSGKIWERTLVGNSIEDYDKFIQLFPKSLKAEKAKSKKAELVKEIEEWERILNENIKSISRFKLEQKSSTVKNQVNEAFQLLNELRSNLNETLHRNDAWDALMEINNNAKVDNPQRILAFQEFIKNTKEDKYSLLASEMLKKLEKEAREDLLWAEIENKRSSTKNTRRNFVEYIHDYKYGRYITNAEEYVRDISCYIEAERLIKESKDLLKGRELLKKYINSFPNGFYNKRARKELGKITIEAQSEKIRIDFQHAKEDNNLEQIYDLVNHIRGLKDQEVGAVVNKEVLVEAQKMIFDYEQDKNSHYEQVRNSDKINELKLFIEKYSDDSLAIDFVEKINISLHEKDGKLFFEAEESKSLDAYLEYQQTFKYSGDFSSSAAKRIEELRLYESAKTKENYQQYIQKYQERGLMLAEAQNYINDIEFKEEKELAYERAINGNCLELCEQYFKVYNDIKDNQWNEIDALFKKLSTTLRASELFEEIKNAKESKEKLSLCRSYTNKYLDKENIEEVVQISQKIQKELDGSIALKYAIEAMNIEALENYKKQHTQNHEEADDYMEYLNAKKTKTKEAFESYIRKYEGVGLNHLRAEDGLKYIEALAMNEIEAFDDYIKASIEKEFEDDAQENIKILEGLKEVKEAYEEALNTNTIEQYSNYIRLYGAKQEDFKAVVINKLSILKKAKQDNAEFEIAKNSEGTKLLSAYIGKYGLEGLNGVEATQLLRERGLGITEKDMDLAEKIEGTTEAITSLVKQLQRKEEKETKAKVKEEREAKTRAKEEKEAKEKEVKAQRTVHFWVTFVAVMLTLVVVGLIILLSR